MRTHMDAVTTLVSELHFFNKIMPGDGDKWYNIIVLMYVLHQSDSMFIWVHR